MLRAEGVEGLARIGRMRDAAEDNRRLGERLRQLNVVAYAGVRKAPGLQVSCINKNRLGEFELGLGQSIRPKAGKFWRLLIAGLEAVGIRTLHAGDGRRGARILDTIVEPK